jgi:hypothetical protein
MMRSKNTLHPREWSYSYLALVILLVGVCIVLTSVSHAQSGTDKRVTLVCIGTLTRSDSIIYQDKRIEFSLSYLGASSTTFFESSINLLNGPIQVEVDELFVVGKEAAPRMRGPTDHVFRMTELRISRNTGHFTLGALLSGPSVLYEMSTWEGECKLMDPKARKF